MNSKQFHQLIIAISLVVAFQSASANTTEEKGEKIIPAGALENSSQQEKTDSYEVVYGKYLSDAMVDVFDSEEFMILAAVGKDIN